MNIKNISRILGKIWFQLTLFLVISVSCYEIIDFCIFDRFLHVFQWYIGSEELSSFQLFIRKRNSLNWNQDCLYNWGIFGIAIVNYILVNINIKRYKNMDKKPIVYLGIYFCSLVFITMNFRFFGDTDNLNVEKLGWYYVFVAIPTYILSIVFCFVFFLFLKRNQKAILEKIYLLLNKKIGKWLIFLSTTYLIYYMTGCIFAAISHGTNSRIKYFSNIGKDISDILYIFCFENWKVSFVSLAILIIAIIVYVCLIKRFKTIEYRSRKKAVLFLMKSLIYLSITVSSVKVISDYYAPSPYPRCGYTSIFYYAPLITSFILFLKIILEADKHFK